MKTAWTFLAVLVFSLSTSPSAHGTLDQYGAWLEGTITNPSGTTYYGGNGTQSLPGPTFGIGTSSPYVDSYIDVITGQSGLASQSEANFGGETLVKATSHYYDTFTFTLSTTTPVRINYLLHMSYRFISPTTYEWYPKYGEAGFIIYLNPNLGEIASFKRKMSDIEDHTGGSWDVPVYSSMTMGPLDLGLDLRDYCGRSTRLISNGDQVSLAFEYYTLAKNGATVEALYTGDFKFLLTDEAKAAGAYLIVTSTSGFYQTDGVVPKPAKKSLPAILHLLLSTD